MMVQTFSYIIRPSLVMVIVPCKKETRSNSRLFRDRKVPKQPTSQRAAAEAVSNYLAGRDAPPAGLFINSSVRAYNSCRHGQQTDCPRTARNGATPGNRWRHHRALSQLREGRRVDRRLAGFHRATGQGTGEAEGTSGNRRPHGRASAGNREDRRLRVAQKTSEEISGDDSGFAAASVARPEEGGIFVVALQGRHRGRRGKACAGRKTPRLVGIR